MKIERELKEQALKKLDGLFSGADVFGAKVKDVIGKFADGKISDLGLRKRICRLLDQMEEQHYLKVGQRLHEMEGRYRSMREALISVVEKLREVREGL